MPKQVTGNILSNLQSNTIVLIDAPLSGVFPTTSFHNSVNTSHPNVKNLYDFNKNSAPLRNDVIGVRLRNANNPYACILICENLNNAFFPSAFVTALDRFKLYIQNSPSNQYPTPFLMQNYKTGYTDFSLADVRVPNNFGVWAGADFNQVKAALDTALGVNGSTIYV